MFKFAFIQFPFSHAAKKSSLHFHIFKKKDLIGSLTKYDNEIYQLACKSGIINVAYPAAELELLENQDIPELYFTPVKRISIREAARLRNVIIENNDDDGDNIMR